MSLRTDLWQRGRDHLELGVTWSCPLRQSQQIANFVRVIRKKCSMNQGCHKRFYRHMFFRIIYFFPFETSATASCGYMLYIHDVVAWLKLQRGEGLSFFSPLCAMQHSRIQQELLISALGGMSKDKDRCSMMPEPVCAVEYSASSPSRWQPYRCVLSCSDAFNTAFSYKPKASPCKRQHVLLHCCFCLHKQFASFYHYKHPRKI